MKPQPVLLLLDPSHLYCVPKLFDVQLNGELEDIVFLFVFIILFLSSFFPVEMATGCNFREWLKYNKNIWGIYWSINKL